MIEEELPDELENDLDDIEPVGDESQLYEHFRVVVDKGQAMVRVDKYLFERIVNASRNRIQKAAEDGFVMANGKPVKSSYKVKPLDVITVMMDRPRYENEIIPENIPLTIVYEDPYLMVVNKPAGLVVHPGHGNYHGTLVNALAWHMKDIPDYDANDPHVGLVHRIDKDTSGLLVIAKTPDAKTNLGIQFFNKTTKRKYRALVWGVVEQEEGTIVGNIARNPRDRMQMAVMSDPTVGKHAVTHYRVLERLGYVTLVECILETGRTHQIRVHMKHIGHVLFNDERYGGHEILKGTHFSKYKQFVNNCFDTCPRQALHAMTLGFVHPVTPMSPAITPATASFVISAPSARASTAHPSTTSACEAWIPHCEPVAVRVPVPRSVRLPHTSMPHSVMSASGACDSVTEFCPASVSTRSPSAPMASPA